MGEPYSLRILNILLDYLLTNKVYGLDHLSDRSNIGWINVRSSIWVSGIIIGSVEVNEVVQPVMLDRSPMTRTVGMIATCFFDPILQNS